MKRIFLSAVLATLMLANSYAETLDSLMAQRLAADNSYVVMVDPKALKLIGALEQMPAKGKTGYMTEMLAERKIANAPAAINYKMWLRSDKGERVMVYLADNVAEHVLQRYAVARRLEVNALHVWNSRHGPGLLVTGVRGL